MKNTKVIFMGTPDFAVPVLQTLIDKIEINPIAVPRITAAPMKMKDNFPLIPITMQRALIIIIGERINTRINIWYEFCTLFTSVVSLVISPAVENLSMFANEKF